MLFKLRVDERKEEPAVLLKMENLSPLVFSFCAHKSPIFIIFSTSTFRHFTSLFPFRKNHSKNHQLNERNENGKVSSTRRKWK